MKICRICKQLKNLTEYSPRKNAKDGTRNECRKCANLNHKKYRQTPEYKIKQSKNYKKWYTKEYYQEYRKKNIDKIRKNARKWAKENQAVRTANENARRASKLNATLGNYKKELKVIYLNCPKGYHVDHIIPLKNNNVCGLHVPWNLQYLPALENISKGNKLCLSTK